MVRVLFVVLAFLIFVICDVFASSGASQPGRLPREWYSLPEETDEQARFRAGLRKAFQIGDFFAARAAESSGTRSDTSWAISEIRPGFTMSIGGGLGLATLTGSAEAVLILQDKNF
jgi:hypothetical protein